MPQKTDGEIIEEAISRLLAWLEGRQFRGWDPHDALNSPLVKALTFGSRLLGIAWLQTVKRCPVNLRPALQVPKGYNPKGMGLLLASYLRSYQTSGELENLEQARFFADWLVRNALSGYSGFCWGYNFDWPNRGFYAPAGTPTIVNTAFIALSFLEAHRLPDWEIDLHGGKVEPIDRKKVQTPLAVARSACDFVLGDLKRLETAPDEICFSYSPLDRRYVHNANLLGAQLLAEVYAFTGEPQLAGLAKAAARFTVHRQREDGSWPYGHRGTDGWVDNFHTGFVLAALRRIASCLNTAEFDAGIARGYRFWKDRMFLSDGTAKYYPHSVYPIDIHSVAQAVLTFLEFAPSDAEALCRAARVARWGIEHMQDAGGFFHYQIHRHYRIRIPYIRWSQAWMLRALTEFAWVKAANAGQPASTSCAVEKSS